MFIKNDLLVIRDAFVDDIDFIMKWESDSYNSQFVAVWSKEKHLNSLKDENIKQVIIEYDGEKVGYSVLQGFTNENKALELMRLVIIKRDMGIGRKFIETLIKYAFEEQSFNKVWLDVRSNNERGKALYKKVGFVLEGTIRDAVVVNGELLDNDIMSILRREYITR